MPLTTLDPNTALIVIDLQKGIVNGNFIHPIGEVIDRTRALIRCFPCEEPPSRAGQCGITITLPLHIYFLISSHFFLIFLFIFFHNYFNNLYIFSSPNKTYFLIQLQQTYLFFFFKKILPQGIVNGNFIHPIGDIIDRTRALIDVFRAKNLPVVLVNVAGRAPGRTEQGPRSSLSFAEGWTDLLPQLDQQPSDIVVTKRSWGAFATTDLERQLKARGVTQVVVTGVVTSGGVEATARQAYEQGFNVTLALDAMTDIREEAHEYSIRNVFPRVGETGSTQEIISLLERVGRKERCIMNWLWLVSYFFGGVFAANAIPHFVAGTMGRPFQSPFAKPPGKGLSSSTVNVVWGFFNAVVGYLLVAHVGAFDPRATSHILAFGLGALLISIFSARHFGQFHGGNTPSRP